MSAPLSPDWIAADWGTTNLRVWAMSADGEKLGAANSTRGMVTLSPSSFESALLELVESWLGEGVCPVVACGMVGSRQGWVEAPYVAVPAATDEVTLVEPPATDPRLDVRVVGGLKQASPPDVIRGEETQIAGFLSHNPGWDGVICLPGTHTKWVRVSANEVVSFQTHMTGELFALLSGKSVLRHSIAQSGWDDTAFHRAVEETLGRPDRLAGTLFSLRAAHLLHDLDGVEARARLSGLLIGAELAAARGYWLGQQVAVIGAQEIAGSYASALEKQGLPVSRGDGPAMSRAGLNVAWRRWQGLP